MHSNYLMEKIISYAGKSLLSSTTHPNTACGVAGKVTRQVNTFFFFFLAILLNYSCSTKYFKKSVDGIVFSVFFSIRKRIAVEIELIYVCTRGRKIYIFNPFSSTSSEFGPKILQCLLNPPVRTHRRRRYSVPFRTVVFLFSDSKPYENNQACFASGEGFHGLNGRSPHYIDFHECTA